MQLLDRSSLGRDYNAFKALYARLERALQFVVNGISHIESPLTTRPLPRVQQLDRPISGSGTESRIFAGTAAKIAGHTCLYQRAYDETRRRPVYVPESLSTI